MDEKLDFEIKRFATLNSTTTDCVDKINDINVVVCVPRPIQHWLQPSVCLMTGLMPGLHSRRDSMRRNENESVKRTFVLSVTFSTCFYLVWKLSERCRKSVPNQRKCECFIFVS